MERIEVREELRFMANRLKKIRLKLKLTQSEVVELISGGGSKAVSRYENAVVKPPRAYVVLMLLLEKHPDLLTVIRTTKP